MCGIEEFVHRVSFVTLQAFKHTVTTVDLTMSFLILVI